MTSSDSASTGTRSAITSVWAWGNSVDPDADERGLGQPDMAPAAVASFAHQHALETVYLNAPWNPNRGAIADWLSLTVTALHARGIRVAALGGAPSWLDDAALAVRWIADARSAAPFDAVQLDVEPWARRSSTIDASALDPSTIDPSALVQGFAAMLDRARTVAGELALGVVLPWWLAAARYGTGNAVDGILPHADTAAFTVFSDHADGAGGIIDLAGPAVESAVAARKSFTIGVETDTPAVAGGSQYTFYEEGTAVLESEAAKIRAAFAASRGYAGVTVEHLRAWKVLRA